MEDAEVYEAVKAITQLVNECSIKLDLATSALNDSKEKLTSLLHATMKETTQSSLDDFSKHETVVAMLITRLLLLNKRRTLTTQHSLKKR